MKIGFLIPSTSKGRNWSSYKDSYLYSLTLKTFLLTYDKEHEYTFYIGVDSGDPIYDNPEQIAQFKRFIAIMKNINIVFLKMDGIAKGHLTVMWNRLFQKAYTDNCDYFFQCGDDISFQSKGWVNECIRTLQKTGGIGMTGPMNNNARILTQSFVSRIHWQLFGYYFPEEIKNWFCDDWINIVYRKMNHFYPLHGYQCNNLGGPPRYVINNDTNFSANFDENFKKVSAECSQIAERDFARIQQTLSAIIAKPLITHNKSKVYIGGCVRNCGTFLDRVFANIKRIIESSIFEDFHIIIAYDASADDSLNILKKYQEIYGEKMILLENPIYEDGWNGPTHIRTQNISNARNAIFKTISDLDVNHSMQSHMILMDFDDVCAGSMNLSVIEDSMKRDDWDCISFNQDDYYDIWALSIDPFVFSCWHWNNPYDVVNFIKRDITHKLKQMDQNALLPCLSAFNGFAIYQLSKFKGCVYDWKIQNTISLLGVDKITQNQILLKNHLNSTMQIDNFYQSDCEHRHFHLSAIQKHNARIRICPRNLF